jgi:hypothetical protein
MGMMDFVRSSYNLGPQFTDVELQTKDIEEGYSGTMTHFWIDPAGYLWCPDYTGTSTFETIKEDDPRYSDKHLFLNFEWLPTGQKGKYKVHPITKYVEVYPATWKGDYEDWPRLKLHFIQGKLQNYEDITGEK